MYNEKISEKEMQHYLNRGRVYRAQAFQKFFTNPRKSFREMFAG